VFRSTWLAFTLGTLVIGLLTGQAMILYMPALMVTVVLVARAWNRWVFRDLTYTRTLEESRVFAGETVGMTIELANNKPLPVPWLRVDDRFPESMVPEERALLPSGLPRTGLLSHVAALMRYGKARWHYRLPCRQRGFYFFGPARVQSGDALGLLESERVLAGATRLIVYPTVQPLQRLGLPAKDPFGGKRVPLPVFEDPTRVVGVRAYHPDDPMRRVHWKASARTQSLQVRVWEPAQEQQLVVLLNVATFARHWQGVNRELLEWTISVAASICQHAFADRIAVGLVANASVPQSDQPVKVAPGRSPHQMRYILEALAALTPFSTSSIEKLLRVETPRLGWGATIVIVTAVVTEELETQILRLHRAGRQIALVSLDNGFTEEQAEQLTAQGVITHRLPHRFTVAAEEPGEAEGASGAESWMRPEGYDPHAAFKPPRAGSLDGQRRG
jgi:uncharacterized protein (DUF58 family)